MHGGEGLGRLEGKVVLVPFVLPGEVVRVETVSETKDLIRARLLEVLQPSAERSDPPCEYFGRCGGCQLQHTAYERQVEWKKAILAETLDRIGRLDAPEIETVTGPPLEYRNRVQLHVRGRRIGFFRAGTHELQPVMHCPVAAPAISEAIPHLRRMAHQPRFPEFLQSFELFTNGDEIQFNVLQSGGRRLARGFFEWCAKQLPGADRPALDYRAAGETFRVGHRSFFQVNRFLIDELVRATVPEEGDGWALDLYAGVGLFSLPLARRFGRVTAVESGRGAAEDLEFNAARAGVAVEIRRDTVQNYLQALGDTPDFIVADPPRAGLGKRVTAELARLRVPLLTLVSCEPSTLARDLAALAAAGYSIERMTLIDLFPQTHHIETVTRLRRANTAG